MPSAGIRLKAPGIIHEYVRSGPVHDALQQVAGLANEELALEPPGDHETAPSNSTNSEAHVVEIKNRGDAYGHLTADSARAARVAAPIGAILEHFLDREIAVGDLVEQLITSYQELDMLYTLLPMVSLKVDPREIGDAIVAEASKSLGCRRVSLMILDEDGRSYRVLASRGLPPEVHNLVIPVADSIAGAALGQADLLVINNIGERPDLESMSRGAYESESFAVVRVPLTAHGQALGVLTVTEREGDPDFTSRDRKILEGLSAMGASALLNCRLHEAAHKQMMCTIHALASAVDARDQYTHDHAGRVARLCVTTAREMGIDDAVVLRQIELAALLHDIGKIGIPDAILSKPEGLTPDEYAIIQSHVKIGARIVKHVAGLERVAEAILHHHERYDGLGYPAGLSGEAIPLASALISVVDTFDALTSDRPYRKAGPVDAAIREVQRCSGTQFAPTVVDALESVVVRDQRFSRGATTTTTAVCA